MTLQSQMNLDPLLFQPRSKTSQHLMFKQIPALFQDEELSLYNEISEAIDKHMIITRLEITRGAFLVSIIPYLLSKKQFYIVF